MLNKNIIVFIWILLLVPLGLFSKVYTGIGDNWINNYAGDILYEIFWCLIASIFFRSKKAIAPRLAKSEIAFIPLWTFFITSLIEVLQIFFDRIPLAIRSNIVWKLVLGSSFSWWDFPHYAVGCFFGWLLLKNIYK